MKIVFVNIETHTRLKVEAAKQKTTMGEIVEKLLKKQSYGKKSN